MRKIMIFEKNHIISVPNFTASARSFFSLATFTSALILSTSAYSQTVIMMDEDLLGSIDPIYREQVKNEAVEKSIASKKVVGTQKFKADVQKPNTNYKKKRGIIKTKEAEIVEAKAVENSLQSVFSAPIEEETPLNTTSTYGSAPIDERTNLTRAQQTSLQAGPQALTQSRAQRDQAATAVLDDITTSGIPTRKANNSVAPLQAGNKRVGRENPFLAQGFRLGTWSAFSNLRQSVAYTTNLDSVAKADGGVISQSNVEFVARSNWARHQAQINASGGFSRNFGASDAQVPTGNVGTQLRLDFADDVTSTTDLSYGYTTEAVTSTTLTGNVSKRPGVHTLKGAHSLEKSGTRLSFSLRASVDRTIYDDAKLTNGGVLSQKDRDNNHYQLNARTTYEASGAFSPFIDASIGMRDFDLSKDRNNEERKSSTYALSVGTEIDLGEKLTGDVAVGYSVENFVDDNLKNLEGFTFNGSLVWSPVRETSVALNGFTSFNGATTAGDSGSIVNSADVTISRQLSDRLLLNTTGGVTVTTNPDYEVDTTLWNGGTNFEYSLNNHLALTGALEYQQQFSDNASRSYNAMTIRSGIRLQR